MAYTLPTVDDFKARFYRDFAYAVPLEGEGDDTDLRKIVDQDITLALGLANTNINNGLFGSQGIFSEAFLLLSAHHLVLNIQTSTQGLGSKANWNTTQKTVGSVQESFDIPEQIKKSPWFSMYGKTGYGQLYLDIILPLCVGNVRLVYGWTTP